MTEHSMHNTQFSHSCFDYTIEWSDLQQRLEFDFAERYAGFTELELRDALLDTNASIDDMYIDKQFYFEQRWDFTTRRRFVTALRVRKFERNYLRKLLKRNTVPVPAMYSIVREHGLVLSLVWAGTATRDVVEAMYEALLLEGNPDSSGVRYHLLEKPVCCELV